MSDLVTFHGATGELSKKLIAAHNSGLQVREITHGCNGYPEPFENEFFVSGFNTFAEAQAFAEANGGEVGEANWKSGWNNVQDFYRAFDPFTVTGDYASKVGDDVSITTAGIERQFLSENIALEKEFENDEEVARMEFILASMADLGDETIIETSDGELVCAYDFDELMEFSYDNGHWQIGVMLCGEGEDED